MVPASSYENNISNESCAIIFLVSFTNKLYAIQTSCSYFRLEVSA